VYFRKWEGYHSNTTDEDALRFRGISAKGSKSVLKDRLRKEFLDEAGLE
jgi:hypothetical protein